ncbi:MAG: DHH family phosphoesterase, partial [Promethearchaeati archaeon]
SMLIFDESEIIDRDKPIFGYAKRKDEDVYKISARAHKSIVEKGVNLSDAIRKALELTNLIALGGGHPPAAGTKIPTDKIDVFLENCDKVIEEQLNNN